MRKILKTIGVILLVCIIVLIIDDILGIVSLLIIGGFITYEESKYPPKSDWHLTTDKLFIEYGQKYVDYIEETIDSYGLEHTFKQELSNQPSNFRNYYAYKTAAVFTDGYELEVMIVKESKMIYITLKKGNEHPENVYNVNQKYFDMIYKIGQFCIYDFHGDENTFTSLMKKDDYISDSTLYYQNYRWKEPRNLSNPCEYYATAFLNDDGETARVSFRLQAYLTDKNVWDQ